MSIRPLRAKGGPLFNRGTHGQFRRGFVEVVWMPADVYRMKCGKLFAQAPVREVRIGNGGGNQDALRLGFAGGGDPMGLRIRWPDGRAEDRAWPAGVRAVVLR